MILPAQVGTCTQHGIAYLLLDGCVLVFLEVYQRQLTQKAITSTSRPRTQISAIWRLSIDHLQTFSSKLSLLGKELLPQLHSLVSKLELLVIELLPQAGDETFFFSGNSLLHCCDDLKDALQCFSPFPPMTVPLLMDTHWCSMSSSLAPQHSVHG